MLKLAFQYMRYYKSQTFAIFSSIFLTAALMSGISSLMYSSQKNDVENSRAVYGDWHYCIVSEPENVTDLDTDAAEAKAAQEETGTGMETFGKETSGIEKLRKEAREKDVMNDGTGFRLEQYAKAQMMGKLSEPYQIRFLHVDDAYREMLHREIIEGREPEAADEIAADNYTLVNLGFRGGVGDTLKLGKDSYTLTGIVKSKWMSGADEMEIFVGDGFSAMKSSGQKIYLKFNEDKKLYKQLEEFQKEYRIPGDAVEANEGLTMHLGGERPDSIYEIVKFALTDERGNLTYVILKLQSDYNLTFYGMIVLLWMFSLFVIYSVFSISVSKRKAEYAMLQTLGISEGAIGGTLVLELWLLFLAGYPLGCLLGNGLLRIGYQRLRGVFTHKVIGGGKTAVSVTDRIATQGSVALDNAAQGTASGVFVSSGFSVAWGVIFAGFAALFLALAAAGFLTVRAMRKYTLRETMAGEVSFFRGRRWMYSRRGANLANVVVRKFMFLNKRRAIGILLSLSVGSCIFLCTTYLVENLKVHAEMSLKSDDGLGSEYRIFVKSDSLADTIPASAVEEMKKIPGLSQMYATKYTLGELTIRKEQLAWETYFDEVNKDSYFAGHYGGICVDKGDETFGIRYGVYGYDAGMLNELSDFLLEGGIQVKDLEEGNKVIAVANMDGQGNYDFYGIHPGDTVTLRVPKKQNCPPEVLKFDSKASDYVEKELEVAAIVSRPLAREDNFLCVNGWEGSNTQSIIMTHQQMEENFAISDYSIVNASPEPGADKEEVSRRLLLAVGDVPKAVFRDFAAAIEAQKNYLGQQQLFFTGIAAILLVISMFHIMNSMNYSILARRREYGIIRAMGITGGGFYRMILWTGILYGILADVLIFFTYHLALRSVMDYYMTHVVQFLHLTAGIPAGVFAMVMVMNVLIAAAAVMIPARKIAAGDIVAEIGG